MLTHYSRPDSLNRLAVLRNALAGLVLVGAAVVLALLASGTYGANAAGEEAVTWESIQLYEENVTNQPGTSESNPADNRPRDRRVDSGRIHFDDEYAALLDHPNGQTEQNDAIDSAWMKFIEENTVLPNATSTSALAKVDTSDRIAMLVNDFMDPSLGIDHYRAEAAIEEDVDHSDKIAMPNKPGLRMQ